MSDEAPARVARRFWELMASNDFDTIREVVARDVTVDWPLTGERFIGVENFVAVQKEYPAHGTWSFNVQRCFGDDTSAVTDTMVTDAVVEARVISFYDVKNGLIHAITEYWPENYEPPTGREHLTVPIPCARSWS